MYILGGCDFRPAPTTVDTRWALSSRTAGKTLLELRKPIDVQKTAWENLTPQLFGLQAYPGPHATVKYTQFLFSNSPRSMYVRSSLNDRLFTDDVHSLLLLLTDRQIRAWPREVIGRLGTPVYPQHEGGDAVV